MKMLYDDFQIISKEFKGHLSELLHKKGITDKKTCSQIVDAFFSTEKHVSVDDFFLILEKRGIHINKEFVALSLEILSEFGYAVERRFEGENIKRYEHLHPNAHHDHFICIKCNRIMEFTSTQLEALQKSLIFKRGWKPLFHRLEVYGLCDKCSYETKSSIPVTFAREDTTVRLFRIESGGGLKKRLTELGFVENEFIRIVKNSGGPVVLEVKESRFAIGRGQAQKILVYEINA